MGRLRGAPGIVNVLLGAQVLGALRCAFGRALKRDEATARSPAPAYGACRWCLHAPYASKLLAHKGVFRLQVSFSSSFHSRNGCAALLHCRRRTLPTAIPAISYACYTFQVPRRHPWAFLADICLSARHHQPRTSCDHMPRRRLKYMVDIIDHCVLRRSIPRTLLCTLCFAYQGSLCTLCSDIVVYLNIAPV